MRNQQSIIIILFAAVFFTHCKKTTFINDTGTNYFMVHIQGSPTSGDPITATRYNDNPQNVVIGTDSIIFRQAGLYHFEGNIFLQCPRTNATYPIGFGVLIHVKDRNYTVAQGNTEGFGTTSDEGGSYFSLDVPVEANGGVSLRKYVYNSTSGFVLIRWSGYLIRKM